jgi:hypothetical protein
MTELRSDLIENLRLMAREGHPPSRMLREIVAAVGPETADQQLLVRYFSEAFRFTEGQAFTIFGWLPDGNGKLPESTLDYLLTNRIRETQPAWNRN